MATIAIILFCLLMLLLLAQMAPSVGFLRQLRRWQPEVLPDDNCPKAAIILCLRGADPFLKDTLLHLFDLDYPNYVVRIIVDSRDDPAWEMVEQTIDQRQPNNVRIEPLRNRLDTCGLKNSSLLQIVESLDESFEIVAFLDADAVPHRTWLRDLAAPLAAENIAATSGQRWYMPSVVTVGSLVRYVWNAATVIAMAERSVWGGSYAIKLKALHETGVLDSWKMSLAEDVMDYHRLKKAGYDTQFVPGLMMTNREGCGMRPFFRWLARQILMGRLYHFSWLVLLFHGLLTTTAIIAAMAVTVITAARQDWLPAVLLGGGLLGYLFAMILLLLALERSARNVIRSRNEPVKWFSLGASLKCLLAIPLTQFVYTAALLKVVFIRKVEWRKAVYQVNGPWQIRLLSHEPYVAANTGSTDSQVSV